MTYAAWSLVAGEQPTTAKWNILGTNDAHFYSFIGAAPLAWTSYTPTLTGMSIGNGTIAAYWTQIGKIVRVNLNIKLGTTSTVSSNIVLTLPVTANAIHASTSRFPGPMVSFEDVSAFTWYAGLLQISSTTQATIVGLNTAGTYPINSTISSTVPFTWASTDNISIEFNYEAA
jgi:hypothetical protein